MGHEPPRGWEELLSRVLPYGVVGDSVLGDLREEYARRAAVDARAARSWYRRAALGIVLRAGAGVPRVAADVLGGALRSVRRSPRLALTVAGTLALGLGANVTLFGIVDRLLLSPPGGIRDAHEVRKLYVQQPTFWSPDAEPSAYLTYPDYEALRAVAAFSRVAAYTEAFDMTLGRGPDATKIKAKTASADFFPLLGVEPILGRLFTGEDATEGAEPTVVLSEPFWRSRFAGDPGVLGRTLDIRDGTYTVIGVTPAGFVGVDPGPVDVFLDFEARARIEFGGDEWRTSRNWWWLGVVARLAPGVDPAAADAAATAAFLAPRPPERAETDRMVSSSLVLADAPDAPAEIEVTRWLAAVSLLVLLIACANVANLLLVRVTSRRQELAVQTALGLGRGRLVAQSLTESLVLAALGGVAALLVAQWAGAAVRASLFPNVQFASVFSGWRTPAFTALAVLSVTCLVGLVPAWRGARDVAGSLKDGARGATADRATLRNALVAVQSGLTVVLLVGAGLFVRSLAEALDVDLGFDPDVLVTASLELEGDPPGEERAELYYRAAEEVRRLPGVLASTFHTAGPFQGSLMPRTRLEDWDSIPTDAGGGQYAHPVGPAYFETLGMEILRGRDFDDADHRLGAERAAVVNEQMERILWPESGALGKCIYLGEGPCNPIVGVVSNAARSALLEDPSMMFYVPFRESVGQSPGALVLRMADAGAEAPAALRPVLMGLSPNVRFVATRTYSDILAPEFRAWRLGATVLSAFGVLALLVAAVGLYSTLAFQVTQRRTELGIRSALGAPAERLVRAMVAQTVLGVAAGLIGGAALSLMLARGLSGLLFQVTALDPATFAAAIGAVLVLGVIAAAVPAWNAARADPVEALRGD